MINTSYARFVEDWMAKEPWYSVFSGALSSTYLLVCWSGLYFGIKYYETLQKQREEALQASALAQEAQVKMLRYQLNPHFMFNTLNAISTLILQPLVENALKYAVAPREEGGRLRIIAQLESGHLKLVVADDGPGLPVGVELGTGRGVGFRNTRERLAALYGEHQTLGVRFSRPGLRIEITLPFERAVQP